MKSLVLVCLLVIPALGQSAPAQSDQVTSVSGESWLKHLHRAFEETSMGKTGRLGPNTFTDREETAASQLRLAAESTRETVTLHGSDLYRLNCQGCHGESGLGAPPEINSVINPTRATSAQAVMERMKNIGMDMSRKDAAELAKQSKAALLQRLHQGGTAMPAFPHLSEPEIHAIFTYLKQLAGVPGAEKEQASIQESRVKVGEHVVKSTCHICHDATGVNPSAGQLLNGSIPPLNTLTTRTSQAEFDRKIRSGAPIMMGTPASLFRGRMPVFYYLREDEVADAYLYLKLYPPAWTVPGPVLQAAATPVTAKIVPIEYKSGPALVAPPAKAAPEVTMTVFPVSAEVFVGLLLLGAFWFTLREMRRLRALSLRHKVLLMSAVRIGLQVSRSVSSAARPAEDLSMQSTSDESPKELVSNEEPDKEFHHHDHRRFESSWLARWLEGEDVAA